MRGTGSDVYTGTNKSVRRLCSYISGVDPASRCSEQSNRLRWCHCELARIKFWQCLAAAYLNISAGKVAACRTSFPMGPEVFTRKVSRPKGQLDT